MKAMTKRILSVSLLSIAVFFTASAQQNLRTAYFLDGYTYNYKLNPAFAPERQFVALPLLGNLGVGVESNVGLATFLYPTADGKLTTFMNKSVDDQEFIKNLRELNKVNASINENIFAVGFRSGKAYHTIDCSLKADMSVVIPRELFSYVKMGSIKGQQSWDISRTGVKMNSRLELAYGYSRPIADWVRVGARVKLLVGLAQANMLVDDMSITMNSDKWSVVSHGKAEISGPVNIGTEEGGDYIDMDRIEFQREIGKYISSPSIGAALDLGASFDFLDYFTASVSVLDFGFIRWNRTTTAVMPGGEWTFDGISEEFSPDVKIDDQLDKLADELLNLLKIQKTSENIKKTNMIAATIHAGIEARMPFYDRLAFGLLATQRIDGPYSWTEGRLSANVAPLNWLSLATSYAISNFGNSVGGVLNIHLPGFNFYVGMDSFLPLMKVTPQFVPVKNMNTNVTMGLTFTFGEAISRYRVDK